jgi:hypothetical protein
MRTAALIAALACAATSCLAMGAHAEDVRESRYGPAPERAPVARGDRGYVGVTYDGPSLGWSGKREIVAPQMQAQPVQQPWWSQQQQQQQQIAPQPAPRYAPQAQYQPQPQYQPQAQAQAPQYRAPQYQQAPGQQASLQQAYAPAPRALPQPQYDASRAAAPIQTAYAEQTQPYQPPRALQPGQVGVRTYSVGRQFGMEPDPIPAAGPSRMILIGPPASAPDDDKAGDDRDWSAEDKPSKAKKDRDQ